MAQNVGITPQQLDLKIKQGESGSVRVAIPATKANGDPLDSYAGWTAQLSLLRVARGEPEIEMGPTVTGDVPGKRFVIDFVFATSVTADKRIGSLFGDMALIEPGGVERHFPLNVTLEIERSFATAAAAEG